MECVVGKIKIELFINTIGECPFAVCFSVSSKHWGMEIVFINPCIRSKREWTEFRNFVDEGADKSPYEKYLNFHLSEDNPDTLGFELMRCNNTWITFEGLGGNAFRLSRSEFGDIFVKMLNVVIADEELNVGWKKKLERWKK